MVLAFLRSRSSRVNQPRLDRLAQACVIRNEKTDTRQSKRLTQGLHLVGINLDSGPEWRLKEVRVRRRDAVPPQGVDKRREMPRRVKPS
jgi:hypothetical protein